MRRREKLALAGVAAAAGTALVARRVDRRWTAADDPCAPEHLLLPAGESLRITVDDGAELAVTIAGEGPDVVLPHCWTGGREVWAPVAHRLVAGGHRVVLYDQRGHGSSTVGSEGFTIPRLGADLRAVLEAADARDAVLAGHSMGGMTIQSLASHHLDVVDDRVQAIVLVSTAASGIGRGIARVDESAARVVGSRWLERAMRSRVGHALVRGSVGAAVRRNHLVLTRDLFVATAPDVRSGWLTAMQTMDLREGIARIGVPTTVVVGTRDTLTPPDRAAELVDTIPGARLVTIDDAGHMLPLEHPDELADAIASAAARAPEPAYSSS
jgi:pimeloyl-ACP methyl ester carboxylesterase